MKFDSGFYATAGTLYLYRNRPDLSCRKFTDIVLIEGVKYVISNEARIVRDVLMIYFSIRHHADEIK